MQILIIKDASPKVAREATNGEAEGYLSQGFAVEVINEDGTTSPFVPVQAESAAAEPEQAAPGQEPEADPQEPAAPAKKSAKKKA